MYENFRHLRPGVPLLHMHGKQKQTQRLEIYQRFISAKHSIMFATDIAARGLDFPSVDWVVQVDCPEDVETYIHRVGRTARYESKGKALMFLCPSEEEGMMKRLESKKVEISKIKANSKKQQTVQTQLQSAAFQFPEIKFLAQRVCSLIPSSLHQLTRRSARHSFRTCDRFICKKTKRSSNSTTTRSRGSLLLSDSLVRRKSSLRRSNKLRRKRMRFDKSRRFGKSSLARTTRRVMMIARRRLLLTNRRMGKRRTRVMSRTRKSKMISRPRRPTRLLERYVHRSLLCTPLINVKQDKNGVKTKYNRMFNRKSQTILSEHYTKLIDHEDTPAGDLTEDFITIKRRDHTIDEENLPESSYLSKRKLKMGQSKKAMLSHRGNATKLVFDEEGESHPIYELAGEEDFNNDGDAKTQQQSFVEAEREVLRIADEEDKKRAKQKLREKKRKMKDFEEDDDEVSSSFTFSQCVADVPYSRTTLSLSRWTTTTVMSRRLSISPPAPTRTMEPRSTTPTSRRRRSSVVPKQSQQQQSLISRQWRCERWESDRQLAIHITTHQSSSASPFGFSLSAMYFSRA